VRTLVGQLGSALMTGIEASRQTHVRKTPEHAPVRRNLSDQVGAPEAERETVGRGIHFVFGESLSLNFPSPDLSVWAEFSLVC